MCERKEISEENIAELSEEDVRIGLDLKRKQFMEKLHALLDEYEAEIEATDHFTGYKECGSDIRMTVEFKDWRMEDIDLGSWIDNKTHAGKK